MVGKYRQATDDEDDDSDDDIEPSILRDEEYGRRLEPVVCREPAKVDVKEPAWVDVKGGKVDPLSRISTHRS